jgi:SAM-dependent methyltransferase
MTPTGIGELEFSIRWHSAEARHTDIYIGQKVNFWRDIFPQGILDKLPEAQPGVAVSQDYPAGELTPMHSQGRVFNIRRRQFDQRYARGALLQPRAGRFYPIGILQGLPGYFREDRHPCRCLEAGADKLRFDTNHPLSAYPLQFGLKIRAMNDKPSEERGGRCIDWGEMACEGGPGMQARPAGAAIQFFEDAPFARMDSSADAQFYHKPRLVTHLDSKAIAEVSRLYASLLQPGMAVLDLMSSWRSHLPPEVPLARVAGLGMNAEELAENPQLTERVTQDVNEQPRLPFKDAEFDAVICTVSVEYLTQPVELFRDVARILKPGGLFALTFSNRWFPPKVVKIWTDLHEFERMGLVLDYFLRSGAFQELETWSLRGQARPEDDLHADTLALSDPVYAAWGRKG